MSSVNIPHTLQPWSDELVEEASEKMLTKTLSGIFLGSQCTQTCGTTATKTRRRYIFSYPSCGGMNCPLLAQTVTCYLRCCPVNCRYLSSNWGYCYGCGTNGKRTRYNYITQRAQCGGTCSVQYKETQKCNTGR